MCSSHGFVYNGQNPREVKNVKKPNGAKPGMVIYVSYQTAYVTPDLELEKRLLVE